MAPRKVTRDLGSELRRRRLEDNLTQEAAAKQFGCSQQRYANWENGRVPRPGTDGYTETIRAIARFLDVSVTEVLRLAYIPEEPKDREVKAMEKRIAELTRELAGITSGKTPRS